MRHRSLYDSARGRACQWAAWRLLPVLVTIAMLGMSTMRDVGACEASVVPSTSWLVVASSGATPGVLAGTQQPGSLSGTPRPDGACSDRGELCTVLMSTVLRGALGNAEPPAACLATQKPMCPRTALTTHHEPDGPWRIGLVLAHLSVLRT